MVLTTMTPPTTTRRTGPEAVTPTQQPHLEEPTDTALRDEDLIGDLDPGWLAWRAEQDEQ
jgi:hypothetical protein